VRSALEWRDRERDPLCGQKRLFLVESLSRESEVDGLATTFLSALSAGLTVQSKYEGQFKAGKMQGLGVFTKSDGVKYEGEFADGKVCVGVCVCAHHRFSHPRLLPRAAQR
jgi:hypothetical protein